MRAQLIKMLLEARADPTIFDAYGNVPLAYAARFGSPKMIPILIALGADINMSLPDGTTPLVQAVLGGRSGNLSALLAAGADINQMDGNGNTSLHHACHSACHREPGCVQVLLQHGSSIYQ